MKSCKSTSNLSCTCNSYNISHLQLIQYIITNIVTCIHFSSWFSLQLIGITNQNIVSFVSILLQIIDLKSRYKRFTRSLNFCNHHPREVLIRSNQVCCINALDSSCEPLFFVNLRRPKYSLKCQSTNCIRNKILRIKIFIIYKQFE